MKTVLGLYVKYNFCPAYLHRLLPIEEENGDINNHQHQQSLRKSEKKQGGEL